MWEEYSFRPNAFIRGFYIVKVMDVESVIECVEACYVEETCIYFAACPPEEEDG